MKNSILRVVFSSQMPNDKNRSQIGSFAGAVGIFFNLLLSFFKILVGSIVGSISITADGLNNLSDMASSVITSIGFKMASKPADSKHPFGHGRMEYLSAFLVSVFILLVGFELFKSSITALINGQTQPVYDFFSVLVLFVSIFIKALLFLFFNRLSKKLNSQALLATAKDSLFDCITTLAVIISVAISYVYPLSFSLDAAVGVGVSVFILFSGFKSVKDTIDSLLGQPPTVETIINVRDIILSFEDFKDIHDLIIHNYGPTRQMASVHVEVEQNIDIVLCHEKVDLCEKIVKEKTGVELTIHIDPTQTDDALVSQTREALREKIKEIDEMLTLHDFRMTAKGEVYTNLIFDVVRPSTLKMSNEKLINKVCEKAKELDNNFNCVITVDDEFCTHILREK